MNTALKKGTIAIALGTMLMAQSSVFAQGFFGGLKVSTPEQDGAAEATSQSLASKKARAGETLGVGLRVPAWERTRNLFSTEQTSVYGGVKTESGVGVGAALSQVRPSLGVLPGTIAAANNPLPGGLLSSTLGQPVNPGNVGLDVYSSFDVTPRISLFGRVGYERNEVRPLAPNEALLISPISGSTARAGQSVNYGVGMRMDVTPALGVRVEYSRGLKVDRPDFSKEVEADSVSLGLRWKF